MKLKFILSIATGTSLVLLGAGVVTADKVMSSKISNEIRTKLPKASAVSTSIPLIDIPLNLATGKIKLAKININSYELKRNKIESSLAIRAKNISPHKSAIVGSLEVTATVPASTILTNTKFENAQIVGNKIQISVGAGGLGQALLVPKYQNNQVFFQLESVLILGNKIPASALPGEIQSQIKSKSIRTIDVPKGLKVKSVSISSKGLAIRLSGKNIQLGALGSTI
jgi:hypothetical protein